MKKLKLFSRVPILAFLLVFLTTVFGVGNAWGYTITFTTGSGDGTKMQNTVACSSAVSSGTEYLVTNVTSYSNAYYAGGSGLKLGTSSGAGNVKLTLANAVTPTSVVVRAKLYNSSKAATVKINSENTQNLTASFADYTFNITSEISYVQIATSKYAWIESVTVNTSTGNVDVTGVSLNKSTATIEATMQETLVATITPSNATNKNVTWTSDAEAVATVSNGVVTGVAPGTANITVTTADGGFTASCEVTVTEHTVTPGSYDVALNSTTYGVAAQTTIASAVELTKNDITVETWCDEGNKPRIDADYVRYYNGSYMLVSVPAGYEITAMTLLEPSSNKSWGGAVSVDVGTYTEDTKSWSGKAQTVKFSFGATNRCAGVSVTYAAASAPTQCETPVISGTTPFLGSTEVTIACGTDGAAIYYTTNGDEPTSGSTLYEGAFSITEACTIKAIAIKDGYDNSAVASKAFEKIVPLTTMQAIFDAATTTATPTYITFSDAWVVTGVSTNGKNVYISDGTKGMILFNNSGDMGLAVGNTLSGTVQRSLKLYSGSAELDGFTTEGLTKGTADLPAVQVLDAEGVAALSGVNTGSLIKISGECTEANSKSYVAGVQLYNNLFAFDAPTEGKNYYATGVYVQYNAVKEVMPRSAEDVEEMKYQLNYILPAQGTLSIKQNETLVSSGTKWVEGTEFTLSSTVPSDDYKAGVYTVTDWGEPANDVTADVLSGNTLTMPKYNVIVTVAFPEKAAAPISWSNSGAAVNVHIDNTDDLPTLTKGEFTVTCNSSDENVATVDNDGVVTMVGAGTTTISAVFAGDDDYKATTVSYELTVLPDFYVTGTAVGGWDSDKVPVAGTSYTIKNLAAGSYELKITIDGTWGTAKGFSHLTTSEMIAGLYGNNDNNICFTLKVTSDVTITYTGEVYKLAGNFTPQTVEFGGSWTEDWATGKVEAELAEDKKSATAVKSLTKDAWYNFKPIINSGWLGCGASAKGIDRENNSVNGFSSGGDNNHVYFQADATGEYQFTWIFGTGTCVVTFPMVDAGLEWSAAAATAYTVGKTYTLPTLTNEHGLGVTYSSTEGTVATISNEEGHKGEITLVGAGTTTITATSAATSLYNAGEASYTLTVLAPASVVVIGDATKKAYEAGETFSFAGLGAKAVYAENDEYEIPSDITWAPAPAPVINANGNVEVTATWEGKTSAVKNIAVTVNTHAVTFAAPANGTLVVKKLVGEVWTAINSGDEFVNGTTLKVEAAANAGYKLTALTAGGVDILESKEFTVGTAAVAVEATVVAKTAAGLSWPNATATAYTVGKSYELQTLNNPNSLMVELSSNNTDVAYLDEGQLKIAGAGTATITATSVETDVYAAGEASYTLTVLAPASVVVTGEAEKDAYEAGETFSFAGLGAKAVYAENDEYAIPANDIVWTNSLTDNKVEATGNVTVTATWQGLSGNKVVGVTLLSHELTFNAPTNGTLVVEYNDAAVATGDHFLKGDVLTITATPAGADYKLTSLTVNDAAFVSGNTYTVGTEDIEIEATFAEKPAAPINWSATTGKAYMPNVIDEVLPSLNNENSLAVSYSSLEELVAEIAANGALTIKKPGETTIKATYTATADGAYKTTEVSYTLHVYDLASVVVTGDASKKAYEAGETFSFAGLGAKATFEDAAEYTIPANEITWAPAPAPVINANGNVEVTATWEGKTSAVKNIAVTVNTHAVTFEAPANGTLVVKNGGAAISSGNEFAKGTMLTVEAAANAGYKLTALTAGGVDILESKQFTVGTAAVAVVATVEAKTAAGLSWPNATATAYTVGKSYTLQTLTNPHSLTVAYASSNTDVATINAESGVITVKAAGSTVITATSAETDVYAAGEASYTLDVYGPAALAISGTATKTSYEKGDAFDRTGLVASVLYGDASVLVVTDLATWTADPATVTANGNVTVTAEWEGLSDDEEVAVTVKTHELTFNTPTNGTLVVEYNDAAVATGDHFLKGDVLTITATPASIDYKLASLTVNGEAFTSGSTYTVGTEDIAIVASFTKKPEPTLSWSIDPNNPKYVYLSGRDEDNVFPTAINPQGLPLTYGSLNGSVAEIDTEGKFILHEAGFASMYFNFAGNETYCSVHREYPLGVYALDRIEIGGEATATEYEAGDAFDRSGLTATAVYKVGVFTENYDVTTKATWNAAPATIAAATESVSVTAAWNGKTSAAKNVAVTVKTHKVIFDAEKNHVLLGVKNGLENISSGDAFAKGTVLTVEVELASADYVLATLTANTTDIKATKQFTIGEVDVTIEATSESKPVAPISWSATSASIAMNGDVATLPTLVNEQGLTIMYMSNNEEAATIDEASGEIELQAAGETTIRATYVATPESQYRTTFVTYTLTVTAATYAVTFEEAENGSFEILNGTTPVVSGNEFAEGTELTISTTPATGYVLKDITILDGDEDDVTDKVLDGDVITVNDYAIKVIVTFKVEGGGTALDNAEAGEQAEKIMLNNQLFILRGGKMYDAQGKLVK